jgi:hypothetical protein
MYIVCHRIDRIWHHCRWGVNCVDRRNCELCAWVRGHESIHERRFGYVYVESQSFWYVFKQIVL